MNQDNNPSLIAEATDINTPPDRLRELASNADYFSADLGGYLVSNPNTPLDILLKLGEIYPEQLLTNTAFDFYLLANPNLLAEMPQNTLISLLKLPQVPQEFILFALNHCRNHPKILITIVIHHNELANQWQKDNNITFNFSRANLDYADLRNANLSGADLTGADLKNANLSGADLSGANLRNAYLGGANLTNANLTDANLTDANLNHADLRNANLTDANFDANLTGVKINSKTTFRNNTIRLKARFKITLLNLLRKAGAPLPYLAFHSLGSNILLLSLLGLEGVTLLIFVSRIPDLIIKGVFLVIFTPLLLFALWIIISQILG